MTRTFEVVVTFKVTTTDPIEAVALVQRAIDGGLENHDACEDCIIKTHDVRIGRGQ